jgi:hypothetical protein
MKTLAIAAVLITLLSSCGVIECIDHQIDRDPVAIPDPYVVDLEFKDHPKYSMTVYCERYYDSMCAERANYWAIREVGKTSQYETSAFSISDPVLGEFVVPIPACSEVIKNKEIPLNHIVLNVDGKSMWLRGSEGDMRTYQTGSQANRVPEEIQVRLNLYVNGTRLDPVER